MFNGKDPDSKLYLDLKNLTKTLWDFLPWNKLKTEQGDFYKSVLTHKEQSSPQAIQGMWQAYGQMRSAKISGFFNIISLGIVGVSLSLYQKYLSRQKKDLISKEKQLIEKEQKINEYAESATSIYLSYEEIFHQLEVANKTVKDLCPDKECYEKYESDKDLIKKEVVEQSKSKIIDNNFFQSKDYSDLMAKDNIVINKNITKGL